MIMMCSIGFTNDNNAFNRFPKFISYRECGAFETLFSPINWDPYSKDVSRFSFSSTFWYISFSYFTFSVVSYRISFYIFSGFLVIVILLSNRTTTLNGYKSTRYNLRQLIYYYRGEITMYSAVVWKFNLEKFTP